MNPTEQQLTDFKVMAGILLDRGETLLLRRKQDSHIDLDSLLRVFNALTEDARTIGQERIAEIAGSSARLVGLIALRKEPVRLELEDLLLDAVDEIGELLRRKPDDDESAVRQSLERRILHLAEAE